MLRNHGLLTVGPTIPEAFSAMYFFETTCAVQLRAQAGGSIGAGDLIEIDAGVLRTAGEQSRGATLSRGPGALVWPGLLRRLDRLDPSYRH